MRMDSVAREKGETMTKYIDSENVYRFAQDQKKKETGAYSKGWNHAMDVIKSAMHSKDAIPAADVVPVRHGHYVGEFDGFADGNPVYDMWYCSECDYYFEEWDEKPTYNHCPNCGALMDKDGDGDA